MTTHQIIMEKLRFNGLTNNNRDFVGDIFLPGKIDGSKLKNKIS